MQQPVVLCYPKLQMSPSFIGGDVDQQLSMAKKAVGIYEVDPIVSLSAQVSTLANQIITFTTRESSSKEAAMVATTSHMGEGVGVEQEQC